jgi:hypothetical protein
VQRTAVDLIGPETLPNPPGLEVPLVPSLPPMPKEAQQEEEK